VEVGGGPEPEDDVDRAPVRMTRPSGMLPKGMVRWAVEGEMGVSSAVLSGIGLAVVLWGDVHVRPCMFCRFWWLPGVGSGRLLEGDASEGRAWGSGCGHGGHGWEGPWVVGLGRDFCGGPSQESCDVEGSDFCCGLVDSAWMWDERGMWLAAEAA
jgi:hypothetical protein